MPKVSEVIKELEELEKYEKSLWKIISKMSSDYTTRKLMNDTFDIDVSNVRELCSYLTHRHSTLKTSLYECEINL